MRGCNTITDCSSKPKCGCSDINHPSSKTGKRTRVTSSSLSVLCSLQLESADRSRPEHRTIMSYQDQFQEFLNKKRRPEHRTATTVTDFPNHWSMGNNAQHLRLKHEIIGNHGGMHTQGGTKPCVCMTGTVPSAEWARGPVDDNLSKK